MSQLGGLELALRGVGSQWFILSATGARQFFNDLETHPSPPHGIRCLQNEGREEGVERKESPGPAGRPLRKFLPFFLSLSTFSSPATMLPAPASLLVLSKTTCYENFGAPREW